MSTRLSRGGRLIDRTKPLDFTFNGKRLRGFQGDTLASALLANGQMLLGRSFKYHRPRGRRRLGRRRAERAGEPRHRRPARARTSAPPRPSFSPAPSTTSQNHWPSLEYDIGALNSLAARFLPGGFYYKTFMHPARRLEARVRAGDPPVRRPRQARRRSLTPTATRWPMASATCWWSAAASPGCRRRSPPAATGARVILLEQTPHWGGRAPVDGEVIDGQPAEDWVKNAVETLENDAECPDYAPARWSPASTITAMSSPKSGWPTIPPATGGRRNGCGGSAPRRIVAATGALERPLAFAGNDIPGVMLASAVRDYVVNWAVSPGDRTVIVTNNDDAYRTAIALHRGRACRALHRRRPRHGRRPAAANRRARSGIRVETGKAISRGHGAQEGHPRGALHAGGRGRGAGRDRLRRRRHVGRLVARRPPVVAIAAAS